jgi:CoA:oxalate CoA-transferase
MTHDISPKEPEDALLAGLTVLDMSQGIAGPYCGLLLRQQGARVLKVEPPAGDWSRQMGRSSQGQTAISIACNAGKESLVLDTRTLHGRQALHELAARADVVIQNFRPGVAARMGADQAALAVRNPRQVYVSITGYGSDGPLAGLPALDTTMQASSGLMHVNRDAAGQPRRIGFFLVDLSTGLYAAQNTVAALYRSALTGRGRHVEVSMLGVSAALQSYIILDDAMFPGAESAVFNAPTGLFNATDGVIYISMLNDAMFARLASVMGFDDWLHDETLRTSAGRMPRSAELSGRLAQAVALQPLSHWEQLFQHHDILFGIVAHPRDLLKNPQALYMGLFHRASQGPGLPDLPLPTLPGQADVGAAGLRAPDLGEHTGAVLREFGLPAQV